MITYLELRYQYKPPCCQFMMQQKEVFVIVLIIGGLLFFTNGAQLRQRTADGISGNAIYMSDCLDPCNDIVVKPHSTSTLVKSCGASFCTECEYEEYTWVYNLWTKRDDLIKIKTTLPCKPVYEYIRSNTLLRWSTDPSSPWYNRWL